MQKTLACVAVLLASSLVGCSKDKVKEPTTAAAAPAPPTVVTEQGEVMTPASGTTEQMRPAALTMEPTPRRMPDTSPDRGPVIRREEVVTELTAAICERQARCSGSSASECEETVKKQTASALEGCEHGLSQTEFYVCLTALNEKACGETPPETHECRAASLCLP